MKGGKMPSFSDDEMPESEPNYCWCDCHSNPESYPIFEVDLISVESSTVTIAISKFKKDRNQFGGSFEFNFNGISWSFQSTISLRPRPECQKSFRRIYSALILYLRNNGKVDGESSPIETFIVLQLNLEFDNAETYISSYKNIMRLNSWEVLDEVDLSEIETDEPSNLILQFKVMKAFPLISSLTNCFYPPECSSLFPLLNEEEFSDFCFSFEGSSNVLWVNSQILSGNEDFFELLFGDDWRNSNKKSKDFYCLKAWSKAALYTCILHIYTGWLPGTNIGTVVLAKLKLDKNIFHFDLEMLFELYTLSKKLKLTLLAYLILDKIEDSLQEELSGFSLC